VSTTVHRDSAGTPGADVESHSTVAPAAAPLPPPAVAAPLPPPAVPNKRALINVDDIDLADIQLPTVNIGQGVGEIGAAFGPGSIVLGQSFLLAEAPPRETPAGVRGVVAPPRPQVPVRFLFLGYQRVRYSEKLKSGEYGSKQARMYPTEALVYANGGTTNYDEARNDPAKAYFEKLATALILVRAPDEFAPEDTEKKNLVNPAPEHFGFTEVHPETKEVLGYWGIALWHQKGTSYTAVTKPAMTQRKLGILKKGFHVVVFSLTTKLKNFGQNMAYVPETAATRFAPPTVLGEDGAPVALSYLVYELLFGGQPN
jgi:hypothetical protein